MTSRSSITMDLGIRPFFEFEYNQKSSPGAKEYIGPKQPPKCLFCGAEQPSQFRSLAHIIPAGFGNRTLFTNEECDECNHTFGKSLDDDLIKFLGPERALYTRRTRKGKVVHKVPGHDGRIEHGVEHSSIQVDVQDGDESVILSNHDSEKTFTLQVRLQPHAPANVPRALARMAILTADSEARRLLKHHLPWIMGEQGREDLLLAYIHAPHALPDMIVLRCSDAEVRWLDKFLRATLIEFQCGHVRLAYFLNHDLSPSSETQLWYRLLREIYNIPSADATFSLYQIPSDGVCSNAQRTYKWGYDSLTVHEHSMESS